MELSLAGDDGCATGMAILLTAFPRLHAAIEQLQESDDELAGEGVVPEATLREALHAELVRRRTRAASPRRGARRLPMLYAPSPRCWSTTRMRSLRSARSALSAKTVAPAERSSEPC
jgi:hypothetical protein